MFTVILYELLLTVTFIHCLSDQTLHMKVALQTLNISYKKSCNFPLNFCGRHWSILRYETGIICDNFSHNFMLSDMLCWHFLDGF